MMDSLALMVRSRRLGFPRRPLVMGIINLNDDSICGDGTLDPGEALGRAAALAAEGADIIDVGAESARTNRGPISTEEEVKRLQPFVRAFDKATAGVGPIDALQVWPPLLSVNTWRREVVASILPLGGDILNDMSGGEPDNARLCAEHGAALVIMHTAGAPKEPRREEKYDDVIEELRTFFTGRIRIAREAGLGPEDIILDPGIDFAKQKDDNLRLFRELRSLTKAFPFPFLLPVSRKTVIDDTLHLPDPCDRDPATIACLVSGFLRGAAIFRVHNVAAAFQSLRVLEAVNGASSVDPA